MYFLFLFSIHMFLIDYFNYQNIRKYRIIIIINKLTKMSGIFSLLIQSIQLTKQYDYAAHTMSPGFILIGIRDFDQG